MLREGRHCTVIQHFPMFFISSRTAERSSFYSSKVHLLTFRDLAFGHCITWYLCVDVYLVHEMVLPAEGGRQQPAECEPTMGLLSHSSHTGAVAITTATTAVRSGSHFFQNSSVSPISSHQALLRSEPAAQSNDLGHSHSSSMTSNGNNESQVMQLHRMVFPMHTLQFAAPVYQLPPHHTLNTHHHHSIPTIAHHHHHHQFDHHLAGLPW